MKRILVTGGAGFVGTHLALNLARDRQGCEVIALDNLSRSGSELNLSRLRQGGVRFVHGDVRELEDLEAVGAVDALIECSAEPSVHAGYDASPAYLLRTNLWGAVNCLEHLRRHGGALIFISTSRVYPIDPMRDLPLQQLETRLTLPNNASGLGWSHAGISEAFPLEGHRSLYGTTKLSAELLIQEYAAMYGLKAVVNRCGVLAGPWQMGKVDQGFIALWMARHIFDGPLKYIGFGGTGKQVRDVLHVDDLYALIDTQLKNMTSLSGGLYNVGGGHACSVSLQELTERCQAMSGCNLSIGSDPDTRDADIPYYVTNNAHVMQACGWQPQHSVDDLLEDVHRWILDHKKMLEPILGN
ncbi:MAG: NAD-dependent epimerase/dehydratase family protein [Magnetococcales bacterium]|nr:NAD-dependent epimerase/dehydratase family protein [Magnetococcales bacterium]